MPSEKKNCFERVACELRSVPLPALSQDSGPMLFHAHYLWRTFAEWFRWVKCLCNSVAVSSHHTTSQRDLAVNKSLNVLVMDEGANPGCTLCLAWFHGLLLLTIKWRETAVDVLKLPKTLEDAALERSEKARAELSTPSECQALWSFTYQAFAMGSPQCWQWVQSAVIIPAWSDEGLQSKAQCCPRVTVAAVSWNEQSWCRISDLLRVWRGWGGELRW